MRDEQERDGNMDEWVDEWRSRKQEREKKKKMLLGWFITKQ